MRAFWSLRLLIPLVGALLAAGCGSVRIGRILDEPARFQNRTVRVEGVVGRSYGALVTGVYRVEDNTGRIYVLSNGGVPRTGTHVTLKGTVMSGITVGRHSFATAIREEKHRVHY